MVSNALLRSRKAARAFTRFHVFQKTFINDTAANSVDELFLHPYWNIAVIA